MSKTAKSYQSQKMYNKKVFKSTRSRKDICARAESPASLQNEADTRDKNEKAIAFIQSLSKGQIIKFRYTHNSFRKFVREYKGTVISIINTSDLFVNEINYKIVIKTIGERQENIMVNVYDIVTGIFEVIA